MAPVNTRPQNTNRVKIEHDVDKYMSHKPDESKYVNRYAKEAVDFKKSNDEPEMTKSYEEVYYGKRRDNC